MSYNIQLHPKPQFSVNPASTIIQQGWSFLPKSPVQLVSFLGTANPSNTSIAIQIMDYAKTYGSKYTNIYVGAKLEHPVVNGQPVQLLTVSGPIHSAPQGWYDIVNNSRNVTSTIQYELTNIPRGTYKTRLVFLVIGQKANMTNDVLDEIFYEIDVYRLSNGEVFSLPDSTIEMSYLLGEVARPSVTRKLYARSGFMVVVGKHIDLSGSNLTLYSEDETQKIYTGSGTQDITYALAESINSASDLEGYYSTTALYETPLHRYELGIQVRLFGNESLEVQPFSLEWTAVKGQQEATWKELHIEGIGIYTIEMPNWLTIDGPANGTDSETKLFAPLTSANLDTGEYYGEIVITAGSQSYKVQVKHTVVGSQQHGFSPKGLNFTYDDGTISTIYGQNNDLVEFDFQVTANRYNSIELLRKSAVFEKGIFRQKCTFWLGKVIDKVMPELTLEAMDFSQLNADQGLGMLYTKVFRYYNPSETNLTVRIIDRLSGEIRQQMAFEYIKFLRGRRPSRVASNTGIIDYFDSAIRVTPKSFAMLNLLWRMNAAILTIKRNGSKVATINPNRMNSDFFGIQLSFQNFTPGDVISIETDWSLTAFAEQRFVQHYIVFPEGKNSQHIGWEDEHGALQLYEFTGDFSFAVDKTSLEYESVANENIFTRKLGVLKKYSFKINTGFTLKSNQDRIDSLTDSRKAWLFFPDKPPLSIVSPSLKMTTIDSVQQLYDYTLEFKINPRHEFENPTF